MVQNMFFLREQKAIETDFVWGIFNTIIEVDYTDTFFIWIYNESEY